MPHISASQISEYLQCRLKWAWREEKVESAAQSRGKDFHRWWAGEIAVSTGEAIEPYTVAYSVAQGLGHILIPADGHRHEYEVKIPIGRTGLELWSYFDALTEEGGVVTIDEVKTFGNLRYPPKPWWTVQPWVYLAALSQLFPDVQSFDFRYTFVNPEKCWQEEYHALSRKEGEWWWRQVVRLAPEMMEAHMPSQIALPTYGEHCMRCDFRDRCKSRVLGFHHTKGGWEL